MNDKCDPCPFCRHIYDDSDESVGMYGYGCDCEKEGMDEWTQGCGTPCPGFEPVFASDGLMHQLC